jgi:uncharacterized repeat protein (TIGR03803 family)
MAVLTMDAAGNLYGTTRDGGMYSYSCGNVFKLTRSSGGWTYTSLHDFTCQDESLGYSPMGGVILDANGNLYGTTYQGGALGWGTVWEITP